jgi:hypothetical protein
MRWLTLRWSRPATAGRVWPLQVSYAHCPSAASRVLPPRAAQLHVSRRTRHVPRNLHRFIDAARNSRIHGLGQHIGIPAKTFDALAWQSVFSQSVHWPAFAGRGGAGDGAVLFVFG